jgi:hypothetical protein
LGHLVLQVLERQRGCLAGVFKVGVFAARFGGARL